MKNFKLFIAVFAMVILTAICASAATVTYDIAEIEEGTGVYGVSFHYNMELEETEAVVGTFTTRFTYNSDKFVLINTETLEPVADYTEERLTPIMVNEVKKGLKKYSYNLADAGANTWTVNEGTVAGYITAYTQDTVFDVNDTLVLNVVFMLADGVTLDDLVSTDFVIDSVYIKDTVSGTDYGYQYTNTTCEEEITVVNNVVPEPVVEETYWNVGNGYNLVDMAGDKVADNSPVTKSGETETEVTVKYGGYYQGTANWSGAALKEAVTVDGLEIEVSYAALPSSTDCWAYIGVLADPSIFSTTTPYNNGYVNLIRYYNDNLAVYGTTAWTPAIGTYGANEGIFAIEAGDTLRVCFDKNEEGTYDITYIKNGTEFFQLPVALDLEAALGGTTGYPVVSASCKGSEANAFEYTVDIAPAEIKVAKIPVAAGDTVYEYAADGSYTATEIDADGTYNVLVPETDYIPVIVNSGYTAQKMYNVGAIYEGYYDESTFAANGVLGDDEVSVRVVDPQGIKFFGTVSNGILDAVSEYGFIMTAESAYNNLGEDYVLDMALVEAGKAKKGVAYDGNGTDIYFSRDTEATVIAGVLYGIPKTAEGVQTVIVSRPYYKIGDACAYGEETAASLYEIAKKVYNVAGYEAAWEYAKEVIELVDGPMGEEEEPELENEIVIDVGSLYE